MKWCVCFLAVLTAGPCLHAAEGSAAELERARAARADGLPQAAISDLKAAVARESGPAASAAMVELVRCLLAADRENEALAATQDARFASDPAVIFWRAQALAQAGRHEAALAAYTRAGARDATLAAEASLGRARMLDALGRSDEALAVYDAAARDPRHGGSAQLAAAVILARNGRGEEARRRLEALQPQSRAEADLRRYLLANLALAARHGDEARRQLAKLDSPDPRISSGRVIGEAELAAADGDLSRAQAIVETFVRENPRHPMLSDLLAKLDDLRSREKDPSNATLKQWENDDEHPELGALASYYLARSDERQGRVDRAARNYAEFIAEHPTHALRSSAEQRLARLRLEANDAAAAAAVLAPAVEPTDGAQAARLQFLRGATAYARADYPAAADSFVQAANLDLSLAGAALANAALAAVAAGDEARTAEILNALRKESLPIARRIELAQALERARLGAPDAAGQLQAIADRGGAAGQRARLATAEWRWQQGDAAGARSAYRRVANSKAAGQGDQRDYFAVYLADDGSERAVDAVAATARDFLSRHPDSPREADVRLKWGEVLLRAGDYRGARVQFEEAARATNDPERRSAAFFLAARSAAGSMLPTEIDAAIPLFEEVITAGATPALADQARWEQARLQSALGRPDESVRILDRLIAGTKDRRLELAARLKRGDALMALAEKEPARRAEALAEWRRIATAPDALPAERNEALVHAAAANQQAGDLDAALAAYYEVLSAPRSQQPEYFWYYKAGFDAANLLASKNRLKEAAAIYEKMAAVPGPRAQEAAERVKRLRLENFIWEN